MMKKLLLCLILILTVSACKSSTESQEESPLIGTWVLNSMKINGSAVDQAIYTQVPAKILFSYNGNGTIWIENYGKPAGTTSIVWSTAGSTLHMTPEGGTDKPVTYSVSGNQFTMTDQANYQFTFTKQ